MSNLMTYRVCAAAGAVMILFAVARGQVGMVLAGAAIALVSLRCAHVERVDQARPAPRREPPPSAVRLLRPDDPVTPSE